MTEKTVLLEDTNPQEFYGANNRYFNLLKSFYPKLKITARGDKIKINGDEDIIEQFEEKLNLILLHLQRYNSITENQIERIVMEDGREVAKTYAEVNDVLVHGSGGNLIKARTLNQKRMVKGIDENDMVFAIGPAGTGKTYTGVALAVRALKNKEVRRIILTRPAVEAGENLGFLPGDMKEKLDPYMQPLYDALHDMIPHEKLQYYLESRVIEIAPLAFMRGRTLDNAFVILDEAQHIKNRATQNAQSVKSIKANHHLVLTGTPMENSVMDLYRAGTISAETARQNVTTKGAMSQITG